MITMSLHFAPTAGYDILCSASIISFLFYLQDGFFQNSDVCTPCGCNPIGAVNTSCVLSDGQCYCKESITNARCSAPENGFYARPLDFFIFEAEDAIYPDVSPECFNRVYNLKVDDVDNYRELTRYLLQSVIQQTLLD